MLKMLSWESGAAWERPNSADNAEGAEEHGTVGEGALGPHSNPSLFLQQGSVAAAGRVVEEGRG